MLLVLINIIEWLWISHVIRNDLHSKRCVCNKKHVTLFFSLLNMRKQISLEAFHIKTRFTFWDMHTWDIWKVCLQTFSNNREKIAFFLIKIQTSRRNNSITLRIKKTKFSGYCFYRNTNIQGEFQICISVPLIIILLSDWLFLNWFYLDKGSGIKWFIHVL